MPPAAPAPLPQASQTPQANQVNIYVEPPPAAPAMQPAAPAAAPAPKPDPLPIELPMQTIRKSLAALMLSGLQVLVYWGFLAAIGMLVLQSCAAEFVRFGWYIIGGMAVLLLFRLLMDYLNRKYEITDQRLIYYTGVFTSDMQEVELYRLKDFSVRQGFLGKVFDYGTVTLYAADRSHGRIYLVDIADPVGVKEMLRTAMLKARNGYTGRRTIEML